MRTILIVVERVYIVASITWGAAWAQRDRGVRGGVGMLITVAIHAIAIGFMLFSPSKPTATAPAPISTRIISDSKEEIARPEPIQSEPVLERPKMFVPQPEVKVAFEAAATSAPVAVSSAPPRSTTDTHQVVESLPRFDADYLNNPAPTYPSLSRRLREQGVVLLRVYVLPSGSPETVELKTSSGSARLDQSALAAVRRWKFTPAQSAGRSVGAWVVVPIAFSLSA
jgi:protein TonB